MIRTLGCFGFVLLPLWLGQANAQVTDLCRKEVQRYAQDTLGSEASNIAFDFASGEGDTEAVAYFNTADCPNGQYQVQFYADEQLCGETYYGSDLPRYVGKLLVTPTGCPGAPE